MGDTSYSADSASWLTGNSEMVIYTSRGCVRCAMLKKWLESKDIGFTEKNLDDVEVMADLIMRNAVILAAPALEVEEGLLTEDRIFDEKGLIKDGLLALLEGTE
jgi:glutaredoxin